ncbi:Nuclear pore complex protein NUP160 [Linum perenne]
MGSRSTLVGVEVPIIGSDSVKWLDLSVPPSFSRSTSLPQFPPLTDDCASCCTVGDPPLYFIWRIHKTHPNILELLQLSVQSEFPKIGLRIAFPDALAPFAHIQQNQDGSSLNNPYSLYVLTVSGVAYLIKLRTVPAYSTLSVFPRDELFDFDLTSYSVNAPIKSVAATTGCLVVGRGDGSVGCFRLSLLNHMVPGFVNELRDDPGISRLWGFMSRGRALGPVLDLVIKELDGLPFLFVLHSNGMLQIWDLSSHSKVFSQSINDLNSEGHVTLPSSGTTTVRLWVSEANTESDIIALAILHRQTMESSMEMIRVYSLHYALADRTSLSMGSSILSIPLEEGHCVDVKLSSEKIWILKDSSLAFHNIFDTNVNVKESHCYALQEEFVGEQLFQSADLSSDDLLWIIHSMFSSSKEQIVPFMSSIFLRRLLVPGVHHSNVLRSTLLDYNKQWTETEFQSLTADGLKKEISSLVDDEGLGRTPTSTYDFWKNFFGRYFSNWCKNNSPCGLIVQPVTGGIGLVRKDSVSLFRNMANIELMADGYLQEFVGLLKPGLELSGDNEHDILLEVLKCVNSMSQPLGKTASAVLYEALVSKSNISLEDFVSQLLKILQTGCTPLSLFRNSDLTADFDLGKVADHRNLRKFSVDMILSLHALSRKATSWGKVLNAIESYIQSLVPQKILQNLDAEVSFNVAMSALVQAVSQVAQAMFESAMDILLFVNYLINISGKINMLHADVSRMQLELVPMIQDTVYEWLIINFLVTTPSESPGIEDFSCQLSSLRIDNKNGGKSWSDKFGKCGFTLAFVLLMSYQTSSQSLGHYSSHNFPDPRQIITAVQDVTSWIIWGNTGVQSNSSTRHYAELGLTLLRHGQYYAAECLLTVVEANMQREKIFRSLQENDCDWCVLQHLLGCCLLAQARFGFPGMKEKKICEAIRCFFRASSGEQASKALQDLSDTGLPPLCIDDPISSAAWKLHYYQWAMQIFEQYSFNEGAYQFALAALEQVDEATSPRDGSHLEHTLDESSDSVKGRLWANVFKFTLDLSRFYDAYCAIISNPDEESKQICLRRFIIVLYERGAMKVLCDGKLPFTGLAEKIECELAWKAERADILAKPNIYKLLYAFEMHRHNWRRAASYIYEYSFRLKTEVLVKDKKHSSLFLQERLNGISAAINALHLVHPGYAWIEPLSQKKLQFSEGYPHKKARKTEKEQLAHGQSREEREQSCIDLDKLQDEFVLASAEYTLSLANIEWSSTGKEVPSGLVDILVQANLYDMAFTVILKFWKGSGLRRELERAFSAMSLKCFPNKISSSCTEMNQLLLTSSEEENTQCSPGMGSMYQQPKGTSQWETLEFYLVKYKVFHAGLPVTVAETLLRTDPHIELPLWLVQMFKDGLRDRTLGMTGQESNAASLLRLYVNYGRHMEAVNLLVEYIDSFAAVRQSNLIKCKRPLSSWFPYSTVELLWCQLEDSVRSGRLVDQCEKLKNLLHGALHKHLKLVSSTCQV